MKEIVCAVILFIVAALAYVISILAFLEKGLLLNNAYIYASKEERKNMNKKPHYRQSAIIFLFIGKIFMFNGLAILFDLNLFSLLSGLCLIATIVYAIISSLIIG